MDQLLIHQGDNVIAINRTEGQGEVNIITHVQLSNELYNFKDVKGSEMFVDYPASRGL
jgi:hypothetical protein